MAARNDLIAISAPPLDIERQRLTELPVARFPRSHIVQLPLRHVRHLENQRLALSQPRGLANLISNRSGASEYVG